MVKTKSKINRHIAGYLRKIKLREFVEKGIRTLLLEGTLVPAPGQKQKLNRRRVKIAIAHTKKSP
jgi:hypothetical protein